MPAWPYEPRQPLVPGLEPPDPPEPEPDDDNEYWDLGGEPDDGDVPSLAEQLERCRG